MMKKNALLVALSLGASLVWAQTPNTATSTSQDSAASRLTTVKLDKDQLTFNIESVVKLLTTSSAAKQIESSKVPDALARRDKALQLQKEAKAALDVGDLPKASALLNETRTVFFEAVRLAAPEEIHAQKLEQDYKSRHESVKALLSAYQRVASEKGSAATGVKEAVTQIERSIMTAEGMAKGGRFKEGRAELDQAYLVAKAGISNLRSGDTLVRSLNFASKEEEYNYEVERNNTHQMLIKALVDEKKASDPVMQNFLSKSKDLRNKAEQAGAQKDYEGGIKSLEESTQDLIRAIRNAGIFIPG